MRVGRAVLRAPTARTHVFRYKLLLGPGHADAQRSRAVQGLLSLHLLLLMLLGSVLDGGHARVLLLLLWYTSMPNHLVTLC